MHFLVYFYLGLFGYCAPITAVKVCTNYINVFVLLRDNNTWNSLELLKNNVNQRSDILVNTCIKFFYSEFLGDNIGLALNSLVKALSTTPHKHVIFGPDFSSQASVVSELARYYNLPQIAFSVTLPTMANKKKHPLFMRSNPTMVLHNKAIYWLLKKFAWSRVATVTGDPAYVFETYTKFRDLVEHQIPMSNVSITVSTTFKSNARFQLEYLKRTDPRILIGFPPYSSDSNWHLTCDIHLSKLFGPNIQWLLNGVISLYPSTPTKDCSVDDMRKVSNGIISFENLATVSFNKQSNVVSVIGGKTLFDSYVALWRRLSPSFYSKSGTLADAFWTIVIGFENMIKENGAAWLSAWNYTNKTLGQMVYWKMTNVTFVGYSGDVSYKKDGDRHDTSVIRQGQNDKITTVGTYVSSTDTLTMEKNVWFENGKPPKDRRVEITEYLSVSPAIRYVVVALASIGSIFACFCICFNLRYRGLRYIRMSSPRINNVMSIGCFISYVGMVAVSFQPHTIKSAPNFNWLCTIRIWLIAIGFDLAFGSMFVKMWRVHYVFANKKVIRRAIKDWHLLLIIAIFTCLDVIILVAQVAVSPVQWQLRTVGVPMEKDGVAVTQKIITCSSKSQMPFVIPIYAFKGLLLIFGIFFAWETRNITVDALNDSKQVGVCVYSVMVMSAITVPLLYMLPADQLTLSTCFLNLAIFVCACTALLLVFAPKMYTIQKNGSKIDDEPVLPFKTTQNHDRATEAKPQTSE